MSPETTAEFGLATCQTTYFTPDEQALSPRQMLSGALASWLGTFDGEPGIFPIEHLPPEIPYLTIPSEGGGWRCEVARARINIHWTRSRTAASLPSLAEVLREAIGFCDDYIARINARVSRLAVVVRWYSPHENPGMYLARHFVQERWHTAPFNRPESFELHAHKAFKLPSGQLVNSWVRCKSGRLLGPPGPEPIVLVEQDLNTPQDESRAFDPSERSTFFREISEQIPHILGLYFPRG